MAVASFSAKFKEKTNPQNINVSFQDDTSLPFDEAAQVYNYEKTVFFLSIATIAIGMCQRCKDVR